MNISYINVFGPNIRGHAYKYGTILKRLLGGEFISPSVEGDCGSIQRDMRAFSEDGKNKTLFVIPGQNFPFWETALELKCPYVVMEHDVWSLVTGQTSLTERAMLENAEGIIFTSEDHLAYCKNRYDLPPSMVLYLRPLASDLVFTPRKKEPSNSIILCGGVVGASEMYGLLGYKAYHGIIRKLFELGWEVHLVAPQGFSLVEYQAMGCKIHPPLGAGEIYPFLSRFRAGFVGYAPGTNDDYVKTCRPNKLWDYLGGGIPTLVGQCVSLPPGGEEWCLPLCSPEKEIPLPGERIRLEQVIDQDTERIIEFFKGMK